MRKLPLLALFPALFTAAGTAAFTSVPPAAAQTRSHESHHGTSQRQSRAVRLDASLAEASLDLRSRAWSYPLSPLSFAVRGAPVLGGYLPPAARRRRLLAAARLARREAALRSAAARRRAEDAQAGGVWLALRECESGNDYGADTGNGYYGAYQFLPGTWASLGYGGMPNAAPPAVQDAAARQLEAVSGWGSWPVCSVTLGLR